MYAFLLIFHIIFFGCLAEGAKAEGQAKIEGTREEVNNALNTRSSDVFRLRASSEARGEGVTYSFLTPVMAPHPQV